MKISREDKLKLLKEKLLYCDPAKMQNMVKDSLVELLLELEERLETLESKP